MERTADARRRLEVEEKRNESFNYAQHNVRRSITHIPGTFLLFMPPPTTHSGGIMFSGPPSVRRDISVLSGGISMKLATFM